jgi:exodeoxyribonuclease VII large subunit
MAGDKVPSNAPEWSVSDLAGALKRTLEDAFGHVRLRGEISGYRGPHSSGHAYFCLKDQNARIDAVIWKSAFSRLKLRPEEGMEVIAIGRITTFPGKSTYQIVVESLEPAGIGALMALLEERRRKLLAEGLFDAARKRPLPFLPCTIGVVTSPTGAVIRDILHRLEDRFACDVVVWPVRVQGETCAAEVAAAIRGFNALPADGPVPRPDVLIVARGGGSIEDLWGFNDEAVVRATAASAIPVVSAVGHETDWTLIDHVADLRAPTPTGAAEMVVPVRSELLATVRDLARRHDEALVRSFERRKSDLRSAARALPTPEAFFAAKRQRLDLAAARLGPGLVRCARQHEARLKQLLQRLSRVSPVARIAGLRARVDAVGERPRDGLGRLLKNRRDALKQTADRLRVARHTAARAEAARLAQRREIAHRAAERLHPAVWAQIERKRQKLAAVAQLFDSLNYKSVLERGYALVWDADGMPVRSPAGVVEGQALTLEFASGKAEATGGRGQRGKAGRGAAKPLLEDQGALF